MGGMVSKSVSRTAKNWNVENRAAKEVEKHLEKPKMAPKHKTTEELIEKFQKENPDILQVQKTKDDSLHNRLKGLVANPDKIGEVRPVARPLPEDRSMVDDPEFGYLEPVKIPEGKCSMRQALQFITNHHIDPKQYSVEAIASTYKLDENELEKVLKHFHTMEVQFPMTKDGRLSDDPQARPSLSPSKLVSMLTSGTKSNKTPPE